MTGNLLLVIIASAIGFLPFNNKTPKKEKVETVKIKPVNSFPIGIDEPSDIVFNNITKTIFAVSDNGYLAEIDLTGQLIRKSKVIGTDFEAITLFEGNLVVVDETPRRFSKVNLDFSFITQKRLTYNGGRNKGFECITFDPNKKTFITITERDPAVIYELDKDFNVVRELPVPFKVKDVSSITYHNNFIWILSDEDRTVFKCDPVSFMPIKKIVLPLINPEGITFNENGDMLICSDDMERLYIFNHQDL